MHGKQALSVSNEYDNMAATHGGMNRDGNGLGSNTVQRCALDIDNALVAQPATGVAPVPAIMSNVSVTWAVAVASTGAAGSNGASMPGPYGA
jgi:hypothetical protein